MNNRFDIFNNEMIPQFESIINEIIKLLPNNHWLIDKFKKIKLVVYDNQELKTNEIYKNVLGISKSYIEHKYIKNILPNKKKLIYWRSQKGPIKYCSNHDYISLIKNYFLFEILQRCTNKILCNHFYNFYSLLYKDISLTKTKKYYQINLYNTDFESNFLNFMFTKILLIFPIKSELDANEIINGAGGKKYLITKRIQIKKYINFNKVISAYDIIGFFSIVDFSHLSNLYKQVLKIPYKNIFNIIKLLKTTKSSLIFSLQQRLANLPMSNGKLLEEIIDEILPIVFERSFDNLVIRKQHPNFGRLRIRDNLIDNNNSRNPFLKKLEDKEVNFILFDAKNYSSKLKTRDLDTFKEYIHENDTFGNFGIILSRDGVDKNCEENIFRNLLKNEIKIIVLDESDLLKMLEFYEYGLDPVDIIEKKYKDLLLKM